MQTPEVSHNGVSPDGRIVPQKSYKALRSEEVNEIISNKPNFAERWALPIFLFVILLLCFGSWFVKYKDIIESKGILTASNAPKEIVNRHDGKLIKLFARNDTEVMEGSPIAWLESTADHREVLALDSLLTKAAILLEKKEMTQVSGLFKTRMLRLGEVQASYQAFITALQDFNDMYVNGYSSRKEQQLNSDISYLDQLQKTLDEQKKLYLQDLQLTQESVDANKSLFNDSVISRQEMRDQRSRLVNKQMTLPQLQASMLSNSIQTLGKQKEIDQLQHAVLVQKSIFEQALHTLKSVVESWISTYVIRAAVTGKIVFLAPLEENQFIPAEKLLGYINPPEAKFYVQTNLPQANFGKLDVGQTAQIRFEAYPFQEFGFVNGRVSYISRIPADSGYLSNIDLPIGLHTNTNRQIQYRNGLKCQVLVITKETRLLQKIFYDLVKEIKK